jgi:predicted acylesterase/phospholipase RssA
VEPNAPEAMPPREVAVALSGGGHRACLFALGVLLYLADAGRNAHVASIASVSGGSLANAAIGDRLDFREASAEQVRAEVKRVASRIAGRRYTPTGTAMRAATVAIVVWAAAALVGVWFLPFPLLVQIGCLLAGVAILFLLIGFTVTGRGPLFGWWGIWAYLAFVILLAELVAVGTPRLRDWEAVDPGTVVIVVLEVVGLVLAASLLSLRGRVAGRAFAHTLFSNKASTALSVLDRTLDQLLCATDLHDGHHVYFSGRFVYGYDYGVSTSAGSLPLHVPMQASAAFPGAFPPRFIRREKLGLPQGAKHLVLVDGGVYDNMADQWQRGFAGRVGRLGGASPKSAEELVVVSASAGLAHDPLKRFRVPLLGELFALKREQSVMYDNGNSLRRQDLVGKFIRDEPNPSGALVHIPQSPLRVPKYYTEKDTSDPARTARAADAKARLLAAGSEADWKQMADANAAVPTTLVAFSSEVTARLLRHAYVLAMVNLHVHLGYPLCPIPGEQEFDDLVL